jgi:NAD-dependent SIR2 family protein deacetylase
MSVSICKKCKQQKDANEKHECPAPLAIVACDKCGEIHPGIKCSKGGAQ